MAHAHDYVSPDQRYVYIAADEADAAYEKAEEALAEAFLKAALEGDMKAVATFAPMTTDYTCLHTSTVFGRPKRYQTVGECMADTLEMDKALRDDAMAALIGNGTNMALIARMAAKWASLNVEAA